LKLLLFFILFKLFDFFSFGEITPQKYSEKETTTCFFEQAKYSGNESIIKTDQLTTLSSNFVKTVSSDSEKNTDEKMLALPSKEIFALQEYLKVVHIHLLVPLIHAP
jgi:hypothetical protein